jgi:cob(I)alamin adenosyltransferase
MLITTKKGDGGESEYFGKKVSKGGVFLETMGTLDELQAVIQLVSYELGIANSEKIVEDLYLIMGNLGKDVKMENLVTRVKELEAVIENVDKKVEGKFVVFKGEKGVKLNWVRTVVRRAERSVVRLKESGEKINNEVLVYLNRLSDFIYLLALKEE